MSNPLTKRIAGAVDSLVEVFAPQSAMKRRSARLASELLRSRQRRLRIRQEAADDPAWWTGGGFGSAEKSRDAHTWLKSNLSPDAELEFDLVEMRKRANSAYKNFELFAGHVERRVNRVSGCGFMVAPQIRSIDSEITDKNAESWNLDLRESFERWALSAGKRGEPLHILQRIIQRHVEKDGEAFIQFGDVRSDPYSPVTLRVEVIHPRRIETPPKFASDPNVRMGVEYDAETGDVAAYHVRTSHPGDNKEFEYRHERIPAKFKNGLPRMVHVWEKREADVSRGYPQGQSALKRFKNSEEYEEAELERVIIAALFAAFIKGSGDPTEIAQARSTDTDARGNLLEEIEPGRIQYLNEDDDGIEFSNPPGPQNAFAPYIEHQGRMAAAGCGTSYEMMSGNWQGLTYSAGKLIWNDETGPLEAAQKNIVTMFLMPMWRLYVNRAITEGIIDVSQLAYRSRPWLYERAKFIPPRRLSIDPARERRASHLDIAAGLTPHSDEVERVNGRPAEDVYADIERDFKRRSEREGVPLEMPGVGGGTQLGDMNDGTAEGSDAEANRRVAA